MSASYLSAVISPTGVPLFIRTIGDVPQLSFPVVGSLNGVHWFTDNAKASLLSCKSGDVKVVWKNFHECITLILVTSGDCNTDVTYTYLLTLIFNAMVLIVGLHNLLKIDDAENLKREMKSCYQFIDLLLSNQCPISQLTQSTQVVVDNDQKSLMDTMASFTEVIDSKYCSLVINHQLLLATESWWQLDPIDSILLSLFPSCLPSSQCTDIPVYLPVASNTSPHRLLVFHMHDTVYLLVLCDTEPSLEVAQKMVVETWSPLRDRIIELPLLVPRCLPLSVPIDSNVLSFCFVNLLSHRCVLSLLPPESTESNAGLLSRGYQGALSDEPRKGYLIQFYKTIIDSLLPIHYERSREGGGGGGGKTVQSTKDRVPHQIVETYLCTKAYKGYAVNKNQYNLFVLYDVNTPTYSLRHLTHDLLESLITRSIL